MPFTPNQPTNNRFAVAFYVSALTERHDLCVHSTGRVDVVLLPAGSRNYRKSENHFNLLIGTKINVMFLSNHLFENPEGHRTEGSVRVAVLTSTVDKKTQNFQRSPRIYGTFDVAHSNREL